jgi:hypothetical protein
VTWANLRGLSLGTVELPLRLYWSGPSPVSGLEDPGHAALAVPDVLREAGRPQDLTGYLDRDTLIAVRPELHLPKGVRQAWGKHHPQLRAASPGTARYRSVTGTGRSPRSHWPQRGTLRMTVWPSR